MDKRNSILVTIVVITTLLIAVMGATFAYFASSINTTNGNLNVDVNTSNSQAIFTATANDNINIVVDSYMMQEHDAVSGGDGNMSNDEAINEALIDNATLNVTLQASDEGQLSTCSYDIVYKWDNQSASNFTEEDYSSSSTGKAHPSKYYVRTANGVSEGFKELTIEISSTTYTADGSVSESNPTGQELAETNIDEINTISESDGKITLLKNQHISSTSADSSKMPHIDYEITVRFYNLNIDQSKQMGKKYIGTISVENVVC